MTVNAQWALMLELQITSRGRQICKHRKCESWESAMYVCTHTPPSMRAYKWKDESSCSQEVICWTGREVRLLGSHSLAHVIFYCVRNPYLLLLCLLPSCPTSATPFSQRGVCIFWGDLRTRSYWSQIYHNEYPLNQALCKVGQYNFANEERFTDAECDTPNMSPLGNLCYRILPISPHLGKTRLQGTWTRQILLLKFLPGSQNGRLISKKQLD